MITIVKSPATNKVQFFKNGKQVYPVSISGNIAEFKNGQIVLI